MNKVSQLMVVARRCLSDSTKSNKWQTVVCSNGAVASWHPEQVHPYEYTRPVEFKSAEQSVFSSKLQKSSRFPKGPNNAELKDIFYTDKNEWFTRTRENRLYNVSAPTPKRK